MELLQPKIVISDVKYMFLHLSKRKHLTFNTFNLNFSFGPILGGFNESFQITDDSLFDYFLTEFLKFISIITSAF